MSEISNIQIEELNLGLKDNVAREQVSILEDKVGLEVGNVTLEVGNVADKILNHDNNMKRHITAINNQNTVVAINPYHKKSMQIKGQLHCHTTNSDGTNTPLEIMDAYKSVGFGFVAITDHDVVTPNPGLEGIIYIPSTEKTVNEGHMVCVNVVSVPTASHGQVVTKHVNGIGGLTSVAHPNLPHVPYVNSDVPSELKLYEIYNGWGDNQYAETNYDEMLSTKGLFAWCVAVDDTHNISTHLGKGFVVVNVDNMSSGEIVSSLRDGNFYASQGPLIDDIVLDKDKISVKVKQHSTIKWIKRHGVSIKTDEGMNSEYVLRGDEGYVRIEVTDSQGLKAWSQPIWLSELKDHMSTNNQECWSEVKHFLNGYKASDVSANIGKPSFFKDNNGVVHFRGGITGGLDGRTAFGVPPGYRPKDDQCFVVASGGFTFTGIRVTKYGDINIAHKEQDGEVPYYIDLSNIQYRVGG